MVPRASGGLRLQSLGRDPTSSVPFFPLIGHRRNQRADLQEALSAMPVAARQLECIWAQVLDNNGCTLEIADGLNIRAMPRFLGKEQSRTILLYTAFLTFVQIDVFEVGNALSRDTPKILRYKTKREVID